MRQIHFDVVCGAAGDMIVSALCDLGVPREFLQRQIDRLKIPGLQVDFDSRKCSGIACRHLKLSWDTPKKYRHLPEILDIIEIGGYSDRVFQRCRRVLQKIGEAEAKVHGIALEKVHFHEIGAVDTIVDVVACALALEYLKIDEATFSEITVGYGTITAEHGTMPVPVPATAEMLQGYQYRTLDIPTEILTPTGCALLTALGTQVTTGARGRVEAIGYGCGTKVFSNYPNFLRVFMIAEDTEESERCDQVCVLESDMDHISGEVMAFAAEELTVDGALDVSWCPVFMKKGRPGYRLSVMCRPADRDRLIDRIMRNTHTLGVRYDVRSRVVAPRKESETELGNETIRVKSYEVGDTVFEKAEYEDMARVAREKGIPLPELLKRFEGERGNR